MMFTLEEVKKAVGGRLVSKTDAIVFATAIEINGVSTDTRTIREGELFIALQGENFDGNKFLAATSSLPQPWKRELPRLSQMTRMPFLTVQSQ